ncbi:MAG: helix-turn-helix domain-containing protein [Pseudonocardiaceae bacterium]
MRLDPGQAGQDRQNLADALRDLRRATGLSGDRLARRCGMSQSKVSRIETGRLLPSVVDVEQMLACLGVDHATRCELLTLARVANAEYQDIRASVRRGLHHRQQELANLEAGTTQVRYFLPALITGLLQTPEYMRQAVNSPVDPVSADRSRAIAAKLARQSILHDQDKFFDFLLTESAVRWQLCPPLVMATQIDRLISVSRLPNVRVGVVSQHARVPDGPMNGFVIYDARLVTIELFTGQLVLRDPKDIDHYGALFNFFSSHVLWSDDARSFLSGLADAFRGGK